MAQKAAPRPLVVARRAEIAHILPHGLRRGVRLRLHQQTFPRVDDLVRAGAVEADPPVRRDGILRLVAVAPRLRRAEDLLHLDLAPADARKIILHAPALEGKLLGIVHVAVGAAAAARKIRAVRRDAVRRGHKHLKHLGEGRGLQHLQNKNAAHLAAQRAGHKDDKTVDARDARALARIALDGNGVFLIFRDSHSVFPKKGRGAPRPFLLFYWKRSMSAVIWPVKAAISLFERPLKRRMSSSSASPAASSLPYRLSARLACIVRLRSEM